MYPIGRYNINFDISACLLCLILFIYCLAKKDRRKSTSLVMLTIMGLMLIALSAEIPTLVLRNKDLYTKNFFTVFLNGVIHFCHNLEACCVLIYVIALTGMEYKMKARQNILCVIPAAFIMLLFFVPTVHDQVFLYSEDFCPTHEICLFLINLVVIGYMLCSMGVLFMKRNLIRRKLLLTLPFLVTVVFAVVLGILFPYLKVSKFVEALCLLGMVFTVENEDVIRDSETGLFNRHAFLEEARSMFDSGMPTSIITIKIPNYEYYNVTLGIKNVSMFHRQVANWLRGFCSRNNYVYYLGQNNFVLMLFNDRTDRAGQIAETIRERFRREWQLPYHSMNFPVQIWLSRIPDNTENMEQLLMVTDSQPKPSNSPGKILISNEINTEKRIVLVEQAIARGLANHSFEVRYQPIYDVESGMVISAEALVRLTDPVLGEVSPEEFIKVAERNGTIARIGEFVFREVCRFFSTYGAIYPEFRFVELNLSTIQCMDPCLVDTFKNILERYHVDPKRIDLEITESGMIQNEEMMSLTIRGLHELGFTFALDDFGTGYSTYSYMLQLPLSIIKIDKSILWEAEKSEQNRIILQHTIEMVKDLGRKVVVEGVETETQKDFLENYGADFLQGYYFAKALRETEFLFYLQRVNAEKSKPMKYALK